MKINKFQSLVKLRENISIVGGNNNSDSNTDDNITAGKYLLTIKVDQESLSTIKNVVKSYGGYDINVY